MYKIDRENFFNQNKCVCVFFFVISTLNTYQIAFKYWISLKSTLHYLQMDCYRIYKCTRKMCESKSDHRCLQA